MPMVKNPFNGQLNSNEIFAAIFNMIISQEVFADNVKHNYNEVASRSMIDGGLYGDTKLFYSTDVLDTHPWLNDAEAGNLLQLDRPDAPKCQAITIDTFRQIRLTVDQYLTKRGWSSEGAFSGFNSVMLGWIRNTKTIYTNLLCNTYAGTVVSGATKNTIQIELNTLVGDATGEEANRLEAQYIAQGLADAFVDLKDYSRDFNDYGFLRSYVDSDFYVLWNKKYANKITTVDLPTIFHKDGLIGKFQQVVLPARYFGTLTAENVARTSVTANHYRSMIEGDFATAVGAAVTHVMIGDYIPANSVLVTSYNENGTAKSIAANLPAGAAYVEDETIICKIVHNKAIKYMGAFEVATSFFNPRSLTENHYLTWGYGLDRLLNYPLIKVKAN